MKNTILGLMLLTVIGCSKPAPVQENTAADENLLSLTDDQLKQFDLSVVNMQQQQISSTLKLSGSIDVPPQNLVSVSSALGGYVKSTRLLPGSHFKKGEILVTLEDNQYIQLQQDYLTTAAKLVNARAEYNRQKELNRSQASSDKVFQQATADLQILEAEKSGLEQKLRLININPSKINVNNISRTVPVYAPFDGFVSRVFVNIGKYLSPSDVMFELVDPRDIHLNLKVFEKDWDRISIGQQLIAYTNSNQNKKYSAKVILIGKNISEDRAVEVHAHFDNYDSKLIPGMYMNAEADIPELTAFSLPDECVLNYEGENFVFLRKSKNDFEMISVVVGRTGNGFTEITNPDQLKSKEIVKDGAYTLLMALKNKGEEE